MQERTKCSCGNGCHFDFFEKRLSYCFRVFARYVSFRPWTFIVLPVLVTIGLSFGGFYLDHNSDAVYLYTPVNAPSKVEQQLFYDVWESGNEARATPGRTVIDYGLAHVIVTAKDHTNILKVETTADAIAFNEYIVHNISITAGGNEYRYVDLCMKWKNRCHENNQIAILSAIYHKPTPYAKLTYPRFSYHHVRYYIGSALGDVHVDQETGEVRDAGAWLLVYQLSHKTPTESALGIQWLEELEAHLLNFKHPTLEVTFSHSQTLSSEMSKNGLYLAPKIPITFAVLIIYTLLCTVTLMWKSRIPWVDWTRSTPWLAFAGVIGAGMGVSTTIGLLSLCGVQFCEVISAMPFLVVCKYSAVCTSSDVADVVSCFC
ncbi:unnamed protein product [Soboliphyme baturini]|uniref:SSD domain-containing protein n=1 Tax=Soboliphyme baturini TaxID=241478 RepID=A0A183INF0_9BILA|nr:unnamed protein product [Soboliphyme baturini]